MDHLMKNVLIPSLRYSQHELGSCIMKKSLKVILGEMSLFGKPESADEHWSLWETEEEHVNNKLSHINIFLFLFFYHIIIYLTRKSNWNLVSWQSTMTQRKQIYFN